ncbi:response regulator [Shivajiella indica]|uniref:Response regulator n=1 Tax=Shivajiella indica TaxID=872115 RepID=A0ABW5B7D5_9BACT
MSSNFTKARIIIVEDNEIFSDGIRRILESNLNLEVKASFGNGEDALNYLKAGENPDMILLDLYMPQMNGLEFLEYVQEERPGMKILVTSMQPSETNIFLTRKLGAHGFIAKDSSLKKMLLAVKEVLNGDFYFPEEGKSLGSFDRVDLTIKKLCKKFEISRSEVKILDMLLDQKKNKEIAQELHLSPMTVKTHRKNIYRKFGVHSLAGIVFLLKEELDRG